MSKKGENIYKRKDGRWEARYIKGCSTEGKTVYGYCYGKTYREAKVKVTEAKAYLTQKTYIPGVGSRRCLASYCDEWLQLNRSKVKESTYVKYLSMLEKHVKPKLGSYYIQSLSSTLTCLNICVQCICFRSLNHSFLILSFQGIRHNNTVFLHRTCLVCNIPEFCYTSHWR